MIAFFNTAHCYPFYAYLPQLPASREEVRDDKTTIKCETSPPASPRSLRLDRLHPGPLHAASHEDIRDARKYASRKGRKGGLKASHGARRLFVVSFRCRGEELSGLSDVRKPPSLRIDCWGNFLPALARGLPSPGRVLVVTAPCLLDVLLRSLPFPQGSPLRSLSPL